MVSLFLVLLLFEGVDMSVDQHKLNGNTTGGIQKAGGETRVKPVAKGSVRKVSHARITDIFIAQDIKSVWGYVFERVVIPAFQNLAVNTINSIARGVFLGEGSINTFRENSNRPSTGYTPYGSMYQGGSTARSSGHRTSGQFQFEELSYDDYGEAQLVLDALDECIENSGYATIADMYTASKLTCPFTGNYYGWKDLSKARIIQEGDKWWLKMPRAIEVKD